MARHPAGHHASRSDSGGAQPFRCVGAQGGVWSEGGILPSTSFCEVTLCRAGHFRARAVGGVRESGELAPGAGGIAQSRTERARGAGREPRQACAADAYRERDAFSWRHGRGIRTRGLGQPGAFGLHCRTNLHRSRRFELVAGLEGTWIHGERRDLYGRAFWSGARLARRQGRSACGAPAKLAYAGRRWWPGKRIGGYASIAFDRAASVLSTFKSIYGVIAYRTA